jgi:uncharacterized protein
MKTTITRYPLVSFFGMAFLFSWIAVLPLILNPAFPIEPFQILGAFAGPTLSAIIVTSILEGKAGLGKFFKRYLQWRAGILWWLLVIFAMLIMLNIVAALILGPAILTNLFQNIALILPTFFITLLVGVILGPLWEEPGWRGFALPRMQALYHPLIASTILGVLWAAWHLPGYAGGWMESSLLALLVDCIAFSIFATWIYNNTGGSILLMILLHSSSNAAISVGSRVLPASLSAGLNAFVFSGWIPAIATTILAVIALLVTRGKLSYTPPK